VVIFDASNPSDWRAIEAEEALFCAGNTVDPNGNIFFAGGHVPRNSSDRINNRVNGHDMAVKGLLNWQALAVTGLAGVLNAASCLQVVTYSGGIDGIRLFDPSGTRISRTSTMQGTYRW
jgi:hypothetical protein